MACATGLRLYSTLHTIGAGVSCGGYSAHSCVDCPQGHGASWCNGDCEWVNEQCVPGISFQHSVMIARMIA